MKEKLVVTIKVWESTKKQLDNLKVHDRQSYNEIIRALIKESWMGKKHPWEKNGKQKV